MAVFDRRPLIKLIRMLIPMIVVVVVVEIVTSWSTVDLIRVTVLLLMMMIVVLVIVIVNIVVIFRIVVLIVPINLLKQVPLLLVMLCPVKGVRLRRFRGEQVAEKPQCGLFSASAAAFRNCRWKTVEICSILSQK